MLPAFTRSQNKTQRLAILIIKLLIYNIISLNRQNRNYIEKSGG